MAARKEAVKKGPEINQDLLCYFFRIFVRANRIESLLYSNVKPPWI